MQTLSCDADGLTQRRGAFALSFLGEKTGSIRPSDNATRVHALLLALVTTDYYCRYLFSYYDVYYYILHVLLYMYCYMYYYVYCYMYCYMYYYMYYVLRVLNIYCN